MSEAAEQAAANVERQSMEADIVCVGFGPAAGGFLTTLSQALTPGKDGASPFESAVMPGMPPQVLCYERADDLGFGVSGAVTQARGLRASLPDLDPAQIPMAATVKREKMVYLLDPENLGRRGFALSLGDAFLRLFGGRSTKRDHALELPYIPPFLRKDDGLILSLGQFNQWVAARLMNEGAVQLWPATPVEAPLFDGERVVGVRLTDQGTDKQGRPAAGYLPGMEVRAALTVVADGPVGPVGRKLDERFGLPHGNHRREWAVGMKFVVELPDSSGLETGTVLHTFGYPEPEIFGFLYVHPDRLASLGIFVPSWFDDPTRTVYRLLQHWMRHPYLWKHLQGGTLRSFGAKSLQESGLRGEPHLVGDGFARLGEGSGSTNVLTGSGVDEAWTTGTQLAEGVVELLRARAPFTRKNLERAYVRRRRESWVREEAEIAVDARNGFQRGFVRGLLGMALTGMSNGLVRLPDRSVPPSRRVPRLRDFYRGRIAPGELEALVEEGDRQGTALHDALMERCGRKPIPFDGKLLISHQDALLLGGKVQAAPGYRDHVLFLDRELCRSCEEMLCVEMCSGQAITRGGEDGGPQFDREKCVHCGACLWNCSKPRRDDPEKANVEFLAGSGGLHSAEN